MNHPLHAIKQTLNSKTRFLIVGHYNPDGDSLGSTFATGHILNALGKDFLLFNISGIPDHFDWLEPPGPFSDNPDDIRAFSPECVIVLDCGEPDRIGFDLFKHIPDAVTMNIDHHLDNPMFGEFNWVNTEYSSVGEMIAELARAFHIPLDGALGESLYLAVVSDTGYFRYGNTRPHTLTLAAEIVQHGLNPGEFLAKYENQWSLNRLKLWSAVLNRSRLFCDGKVGVLRITAEDMKNTGTTTHDCDGLVNLVRRIKGVRIALILREDGPNTIKFSLRSIGDYNVQETAGRFGGGGHKNAAAGRVHADIDETEQMLLAAVGDQIGLGEQCTLVHAG